MPGSRAKHVRTAQLAWSIGPLIGFALAALLAPLGLLGAQAFYGLWTAELFATPYRASAQGVLFVAARVAVGLLSSGFPVLLTKRGIGFVGTLLIGFLSLAAVIGAIWAPETRGKTLRQIEAERYGA